MVHEARFWKKAGLSKEGRAGHKDVICELCPHMCRISQNHAGICGVRANIGGALATLSYGKPVSVNIDPIEKKPLYHFLPGTTSLSIGTLGCNFSCKYCQNWEISMAKPKISSGLDDAGSEAEISPEKIVDLALENGCKSISYTYNEPTVFHEYAVDCAKIARKKGLKNIIVTNGYISEEAAEEFAKYMDAANVDLKAFDDSFYRNVCGGRLSPVLDTLRIYHKKLWVEVTNLVVDKMNDHIQDIDKMARWIRTELSPDVPLHFSRAYPMHKMLNIAPTPAETLLKARETAAKHLNYVYVGNIGRGEFSDTVCTKCGKKLIKRRGYDTEVDLNGNLCSCNTALPGIFS